LYSNGRYCISAIQRIVQQIQRIVQQIQRIVQQKQKLDSKCNNCTDSPEKMQKKQKMYREDGRETGSLCCTIIETKIQLLKNLDSAKKRQFSSPWTV